MKLPMNSPVFTIEKTCPRAKLAFYVDGELLPQEELELEAHLAHCRSCAAELNEQKKLLFALDSALEDEKEFALPADFTKVVVARAQSKVSGLRSPHERLKALFVCLSLTLLVLLGLGGDVKTVFNTFVKFTDRIIHVGSFIFHLTYDVSIGTAVILRSLGSQFASNIAVDLIFLGASVFVFLLLISRLLIRENRV